MKQEEFNKLLEEQKRKNRAYKQEYRERNREHIREYERTWRKNNPDKIHLKNIRYYAKKKGLPDPTLYYLQEQ